MKDIILKIATYIANVSLAYALISFIFSDINPFEWHWIGRLLLLLVVILDTGVFMND